MKKSTPPSANWIANSQKKRAGWRRACAYASEPASTGKDPGFFASLRMTQESTTLEIVLKSGVEPLPARSEPRRPFGKLRAGSLLGQVEVRKTESTRELSLAML